MSFLAEMMQNDLEITSKNQFWMQNIIYKDHNSVWSSFRPLQKNFHLPPDSHIFNQSARIYSTPANEIHEFALPTDGLIDRPAARLITWIR